LTQTGSNTCSEGGHWDDNRLKWLLNSAVGVPRWPDREDSLAEVGVGVGWWLGKLGGETLLVASPFLNSRGCCISATDRQHF